MKRLTLILLGVVSVITVNCSRGENVLTEEPEVTKCAQDILSDSMVSSVGEYHNSALVEIFDDFDWDADDYVEQYIEQVQSSGIALYDDDREYILDRFEDNLETNKVILQERLSAEAYSYIQSGLDLADNLTNVTEFQQSIEDLQGQARLSLDHCEELNAVLITLEIFSKSAYFWAPESIGGSGIGYAYHEAMNISLNSRHTPWYVTALAADGVSGGVGMLGVAAFGVFFGPIGWGALAIVGGEAALNSGIALLF